MKYWDQMQSKYGFEDGDAVPGGIEVYRRAYILAVNALAAAKGSHVRVIPYDRPGCHNWCLVGFVSVDGSDYSVDVVKDEAMSAAIERASQLDIDCCVAVSLQLDEKWIDELLKREKTQDCRR